MTPEQKAAYIHAQAVCAMAEAFGAMSENMQRAAVGSSMAYDEARFDDIANRCGIHHNAVIEFFRD